MAKNDSKQAELQPSTTLDTRQLEQMPPTAPAASAPVLPPAPPPPPAAPREPERPAFAPRAQPSLPPHPKKGSPAEELVRMWKAQKRTFCAEPGCYYPLNPTLDADGQREVVETPRGRAVVGVCSWDPRHEDGEQLIYLPSKDEA